MNLIWKRKIVRHIWRHRVETFEVEEAVSDPHAHITRSGKKHSRGQRRGLVRQGWGPKVKRYRVIGQTMSGRYLTIFLDDMPEGYVVVTAFDSSGDQTELYWRHR